MPVSRMLIVAAGNFHLYIYFIGFPPFGNAVSNELINHKFLRDNHLGYQTSVNCKLFSFSFQFLFNK